jgi:hypothetical protein
MKIIVPLLFFINGLIFLLVSTVFYPAITQYLNNLQEKAGLIDPGFWGWTFALGMIKVIFIIVGVFLIGFGFLLVWLKKP